MRLRAALLFLPLTAASAQHDVQARVERGLLPAVALRGRRDTTYTIDERLRRYDVAGVCLAVIDRGRLSWTRCYGVADAATRQPADTATDRKSNRLNYS